MNSSKYFLDNDLLLLELRGQRKGFVGYLGVQDEGFEDDVINIFGHFGSTTNEYESVLGEEVVAEPFHILLQHILHVLFLSWITSAFSQA